jgi:gliding motility-associated-like protein
MKYLISAFLITFLSFNSFSQNVIDISLEPDCINPIKGASCNPGGNSTMNGNGTLGMSYNNTACGLNYVQASNMTTTRYTTTPGTGFPTTLNISGIPNCASIVQAYVWWGCSNSGVDASFTFNGAPLTGALIGSGPHKCWSLGGTENYRADVTASVTGNGAYTFSSPIGNGVDGVTLMIIYTDPNATYQGTIQINDGDITNNSGGASNEVMTGLNVCANSTFGQAFLIVGDMQDNLSPPTHSSTLNGNTASYPNLFWNFDVVNTNFTAGQTTSNFGLVPDGGGDCYDWVLKGVYYQTTTCATCTPPPGLTATSNTTAATCGNCDGTATVNPVGGSMPYSFSWNTTPVQNTQTATNLCAGTYIVTVIDASGCLQVSDTVTITTTGNPPAPVITPAGPFCTVDPSLNLTVSTVGGTWSGTGITNTTNGTFDPATAGIGSHQIIYTDAGPCGGADTITIVVNSNADATITPVGPYCPNDPAINLTAVDPGGTWTGNGITNATNGTFDPNSAGPGTHTITYGIPGSCGDTNTTTIIVNPPLDATITAVGPYCPLDPAVTLSAVDPGGTWSGNGITNTTTGVFDPGVAGVGTHTITYGIPGSCGDTQTTNIVVSASLDATITPAGPFCESDPTAILTAVDPGGTWSGNGITNATTGTFDPTTAGAGTHTITYAITGSCGDTNTTTITVIADADATITPVATMCIADPAINLVAVDPNGTWTGTGITNAAAGTFDPATAGVGTHTITYTIAGVCGDVQTTTITVIAQDDATITPAGPFCVNASSINLTAATAGGTWSGNGITNATNGTFDPATAGPGTHTITYSTPGACGSTDTEDIVVNALPNVTFTVDTLSLCETPAQPFEFSNTTDTTGGMVGSILWSFGDGNTGASNPVSHTYTTPGTYDITLTVTSTAAAGGCSNTLTKYNYVQVFADPVANFTMNPNPTNMLTPSVDFYDQSYTNIQAWNWNIGGLSTSSMQNPSYTFPEDTGTYLIILTVTDGNGCVNTTSDYLVVRGEHGIYVPNAFTPDFDGLNDGFFPNGFGISDDNYSFYIFDRWGEIVFESYKKFEPWFGTYKDKIVPNGVYVWKLIFKDINGKKHIKYGRVTVVK